MRNPARLLPCPAKNSTPSDWGDDCRESSRRILHAFAGVYSAGCDAGIFFIDRERPPKTVIGGDGLQSAGTLSPVYASPVQVKLVNLIPASLSGETNQDSEPFLAVQAANPQVMVASAFTPNPV